MLLAKGHDGILKHRAFRALWHREWRRIVRKDESLIPGLSGSAA